MERTALSARHTCTDVGCHASAVGVRRLVLGSHELRYEAVLRGESVALTEAMPLTPLALRPVEAHVTAQTDEVLGSDLFNLLLPSIRPDPFELCFRSTLSACAHGSPVTI